MLHRLTLLAACLAFSLSIPFVLAACGDGGEDETTTAGTATTAPTVPEAESTTTSATTTTPTATTPAPDTSAKAPRDPTSGVNVPLGSPADVPRVKGGDNSIADFGSEASDAEKAAAARNVVAYFKAVADGDGPTACALLATQARDQLVQTAGRPCPRAIVALSDGLPARARDPLTVTTMLSMRVDGERGFAIWRATDGKAYHVALISENGKWLSAAVGPQPSP